MAHPNYRPRGIRLDSGAGNEFAQNIICSISLDTAFVSRIDNTIGGRQC